MKKNNIVDLLKKEMCEMNAILQNISEQESVPSVLFQLSQSKIDNMKNLFDLLQQEVETAEKSEPQSVVETMQEEVTVAEEVKIEEQTEQEKIKEEIAQEEVAEQVAPIEEKKNVLENTTEKKSLNERMSGKVSNTFENVIANKKISNLRQAINIVDKFRYQKELFGGNANLMNEMLDKLNDAINFDDALKIIEQFGWDKTLPVVEEFTELVKRKFI